ncbi:MAG: UrcA family protein [Pseudomonadota bacterium]
MVRTTLALLSAVALTGLAHSEETTTVTAELTYDPALLTSQAGAEATLVSFERQAQRACRTLSMVSAGFTFDEACVAMLVQSAIDEVGSTALAETFAAASLDDDAS